MLSGARYAPVYMQVAETIKGRILSDEYPVGDLIASAKELEKQFGVSNITIRKALGLLVQQGYLVSRQGIGTQVAKRPEKRLEIEITGNFREWFDSAAGKRQRLTVEVLEAGETACPHRIREILGLPEGSNVWRMRRVRKIEKEPVSYYINYAPPDLVAGASAEDFNRASFLQVFQESCGVELGRMEQRVQVSVADMDLSGLLGTHFGAPLFFVENTYTDRAGRPVEVTHMFYRGDRYVYRTAFEL